MVDLRALYTKHAAAFDELRTGSTMEQPYLERVARTAEGAERMLDLGCGSSEPIARFFIERGYAVTGFDFSRTMLGIARRRHPDMTWIAGDMRALALATAFDVLIAWDSFFHLSPEDQRGMFPIFRDHVRVGGALLFTSGTEEGGGDGGDLFGDTLYHGSLATAEYAEQLDRHGFDVVDHRVSDPECGYHTIWTAKRTR
ncbi:MAG: class I SAM-dependent methyltransferase [Myxococcota bacterium]